MSQVWIEEACPEEWGKSVVCTLYKDGNPRVPTNYRGITLLSVVSKVAAVLNDSREADGLPGSRRQAGGRAGWF